MEGIARMQCRHRRRRHIKERIKRCVCLVAIFLLMLLLYGLSNPKTEIVETNTYCVKAGETLGDIVSDHMPKDMDIRRYIDFLYELNDGLTSDIECGQELYLPVFDNNNFNNVDAKGLTPQYTPLAVPEVNLSCKRWMDYRKTSNKNSPQYKFIRQYGWSDNEGFMRCNGETDLGIIDDYYMVALGSYYGTTIGTKYRITTDTGNVFYGVLAECKSDIHTNATHQYTKKQNPDMVEFIVDTKKLNKNVKKMGNANVFMPLNGSISKIERIDFVEEY